MNRITVKYGETTSPRQYESKRFDIELETETLGDIATEAEKLFNTAREIIEKQKKVVV